MAGPVPSILRYRAGCSMSVVATCKQGHKQNDKPRPKAAEQRSDVLVVNTKS